MATLYCVHEKTPPMMFKKSSKLASFAQLRLNSMNICLSIFNIIANFSENLSYRH